MKAAGLLLSAALAAGAAEIPAIWTGVERVVAIGDIHGDYEQFLAALRDAGLVSRGGTKWIGGKTHLVQTGDVLDRGPKSRRAMDLLMDLEKQARKAGGAVHALIGNHEAMNIYGDLRYTVEEEFRAHAAENAEALREAYWERSKSEGFDREEWMKQHPPGYVEHRFAFSPNGKYGKWISGHNAVIQIDDTLFLHGGLGPKYAGLALGEINERIRAELAGRAPLEGGFTTDAEGPLWYRGFALGSEQELAAHLGAVLEHHGARRMVIGHSVSPNGIASRFGGQVILVDTGMTRALGGRASSLIIERGHLFTTGGGAKAELATKR